VFTSKIPPNIKRARKTRKGQSLVKKRPKFGQKKRPKFGQKKGQKKGQKLAKKLAKKVSKKRPKVSKSHDTNGPVNLKGQKTQ
jgi:hypothetical protein